MLRQTGYMTFRRGEELVKEIESADESDSVIFTFLVVHKTGSPALSNGIKVTY
jgi:hypothetical protein